MKLTDLGSALKQYCTNLSNGASDIASNGITPGEIGNVACSFLPGYVRAGKAVADVVAERGRHGQEQEYL